MSISLKTHKLLWGRSGNRCAFEDCRHELIADETETDDESIIGDEAHIIARQIEGPRGNNPMPLEERDKYDNLILLCRIHHKLIDDQPNFYTVEKLNEIKIIHEKWVNESLNIDKEDNKIELTYASCIDEILRLLDIDNWNAWTSYLLSSDQPSILYTRLKELEKIPGYIISRFWPGKYKELEATIFNLKCVLNDLIRVFYKYVEENSLKESDDPEYDTTVFTKKFYKIREWNPELYNAQLKKYQYHVDLTEDLTYELTRAANLLIEKIRKYSTPRFREEEGKLLVTTGPYSDFSWKTFKVEYNKEEKETETPYPGLKKFMTERVNRDLAVGEGYNKYYFTDHLYGLE